MFTSCSNFLNSFGYEKLSHYALFVLKTILSRPCHGTVQKTRKQKGIVSFFVKIKLTVSPGVLDPI